MTIILRSTKGANLTPAEIDGNFTDLDGRVTAIEEGPVAGRGIASVEADGAGTHLLITYTDDAEEDPILLPVAKYKSRGQWQPPTPYDLNDTVWYNGASYPVTYPHTSDATFDPGANSGPGLDWYGPPLLESPGNTLPPGGAAGQMLVKAGDADFDFEFADRPAGVPGGGLNGQILGWLSGERIWRELPISTIDARISEADLAAGTPQYFRVPFDCEIIGIDAMVQKDLLTATGGGSTELNGVDIGATVEPADGDTAGTSYTADIATPYAATRGYRLAVVPAGFEGGALQIAIRIRSL